MGEQAIWVTWVCLGTLVAQSPCTLLELDAHLFAGVLSRYPDMMEIVVSYTQTFHASLIPILDSFTSDLTECCEVSLYTFFVDRNRKCSTSPSQLMQSDGPTFQLPSAAAKRGNNQ